jgi:hypothetical protein
MPDVEDPKASGPINSEPEATGAPIESQDPIGEDIGLASAASLTTGAPDQTEEPLPDPFFWPGEPTAVAGPAPTTAPLPDPREVDEIMARAIRLRSVEANRIITNPADIQHYVETCWMEELPAAQAAHAALEAAGYSIVRDGR